MLSYTDRLLPRDEGDSSPAVALSSRSLAEVLMRRLLTAEPVLFLAVGGSVALIGMMLLKLLVTTGMLEWVAFAVQTVVCIQINFAGCWFLVFRHRRQHPLRSLVAFNGARILTGFLGLGLFTLFISWGTGVAYVVSVGLATTANYTLNVWKIFRKNSPYPA